VRRTRDRVAQVGVTVKRDTVRRLKAASAAFFIRSAPNPPPPRALPLAQESLTKQPIVRHSVYQNQCDDDCAYKNPNLVCFAPRPIRAVNPENLADQISNHAVMRKLNEVKRKPRPVQSTRPICIRMFIALPFSKPEERTGA
jgi:hypothetical protein